MSIKFTIYLQDDQKAKSRASLVPNEMFARRLANKTAMVTGSSSGIGRAMALAFAAEAARLVFCADLTHHTSRKMSAKTRVPTHELIARDIAGDQNRAIYERIDVGVEDDVVACVRQVVKPVGSLDCVKPPFFLQSPEFSSLKGINFVNNAGIGADGRPVQQLESERYQSMMSVITEHVRLVWFMSALPESQCLWRFLGGVRAHVLRS